MNASRPETMVLFSTDNTPGRPWENPYIESFGGKFRDKCLNMHVFSDGRHAQEMG